MIHSWMFRRFDFLFAVISGATDGRAKGLASSAGSRLTAALDELHFIIPSVRQAYPAIRGTSAAARPMITPAAMGWNRLITQAFLLRSSAGSPNTSGVGGNGATYEIHLHLQKYVVTRKGWRTRIQTSSFKESLGNITRSLFAFALPAKIPSGRIQRPHHPPRY